MGIHGRNFSPDPPLNPSSSVDVVLFSTYSDRLPGTPLFYSVSFCLFNLQNYYVVYLLSLSYLNVETTLIIPLRASSLHTVHKSIPFLKVISLTVNLFHDYCTILFNSN